MNGPNVNLTPWITEKFIAAAPQQAARALGGLATHEAVLLLKPLKAESIVSALNPMEPAAAAAILRRLPSRQAAHVLSRLDLRQGGKVFAAFSVAQREKMKTLLPASVLQALEKSTAWPAASAGGKMSTDFVLFRTEMKLSDIVEKLKILPRKKLPAACLVAGRDGKLKGCIRAAELAFYAPQSTAGSVMSDVKAVSAQAPLASVQKLFDEGQPLVPVTDENGAVLGVLTPQMLAEAQPVKKKRFGWF